MKNPIAIALISFCFAGFGTSASNAYSPGESCQVRQTRDGFVALRKGPGVNAKRIRKLYFGEYRVSPAGPIGKWVKVVAGKPEGWSGRGYVRSNLVDWNACDSAG